MKCDVCKVDNGKRSRCAICNKLVCSKCASGAKAKKGEVSICCPCASVRANGKTELVADRSPASRVPGLIGLSVSLSDTRIESKVFKSIRRDLKGNKSTRPYVPQGPGRIFATTHGPRMDMGNRHNHRTNGGDALHVYTD